jgi:hypothetical protein
MVINDPTAFKVRKRVQRHRCRVTQWVDMRKGVANLFRYRDVSLSANRRYLEALAAVDDPTPAIRELDRITRRRRTPQGQSVRAFNPLSREDRQLFAALSNGERHIRGFTNHDLRAKLLEDHVLTNVAQTVQQLASKVSRLLRRLHLYRLIAKVPHARRWRVTMKGLRLFSSALRLRDYVFPELYAAACGNFVARIQSRHRQRIYPRWMC